LEKEMSRTIVVPIADMHTMLKIGLMPPKVIEDKGTTYQTTHRQNDFQKKILWKQWEKAKKHIFSLKCDDLVLLLMGDLVHGNKKAHQVYSSVMRTQGDAAIEALLPYSNKAKRVYSVAGTKWHVGEEGSTEDRIAKELGAYKHIAHLKLEVTIQGIRFMLQHKGPTLGSRTWVRGNGMRLTLRDASIQALQEGRSASDIYLWGHFHTFHHEPASVKEPEGDRVIHGFTLPSWCGADEYALEKVKNLEYSDIGLVYFDIQDGGWELRKQYIRFDNIERVNHG
jgi:hypothetical protein